MNCLQTFVFLIGFTVGFFMVFMTLTDSNEEQKKFVYELPTRLLTHDKLYKFWFHSNGFKSDKVSADSVSFDPKKITLESEFLFNKIRLTCIIFVTNPRYPVAIKVTWGKQCNSLHFYHKEQRKFIIPFLKVKSERKKSSWHQICDIMREKWYTEKIDWILFVPDNVLVIPQNIRYLVAHRDPERPYYLGHSSHFWNQIYNSAETAYLLSRGALRKIVSKFNSSQDCSKGGKYTSNEDYLLGKHLSELGIRAEDTRDDKGRPRFHLHSPLILMAPAETYSLSMIQKYSKKSLYPINLGPECCSPHSISFRIFDNDSRFLFLYYLLNNVQIFTSGHLGNKIRNEYRFQYAEAFIHENVGKNVSLSSITSDEYYELWSLKLVYPKELYAMIRKINNKLI